MSAGPGAEAEGNALAAGERHRGASRVLVRSAARLTTAAAAVLLLGAVLLPNRLDRLTVSAFTRIPVEGVLGVALLLAVRPKARTVTAVMCGSCLGLLTLVKLLDMGFYAVLVRPFDPVFDWGLFGDAQSFLIDSIGTAGATAALAGVGILAVVVPAVMTLAVLRVSRAAAGRRTAVTQVTCAFGAAWVGCAVIGVQVAGVPLASRNTVGLVRQRVFQVAADLEDQRAFAKKIAADPYRRVPPDRLLTALRGKDVLFTFVESYGRSAIEDSQMAPGVDAVLADGTRRLRAAGFSARSAFLTSPTFGGGSWLAHSTFLSGVWISNQQRYRALTSSDRLSLTRTFTRTGAWRTVGVMPGVTRTWPEGGFYGFEQIYDSRSMGYHGPQFSWSRMPDQFSLMSFERLEHGRRGRKPLMAELVLTSSHNPWAPLPRMVDWSQVGDGSVYGAIKREGKRPKEVWKDPAQVRAEYGHSIEYSLSSLISYVEKYGDDDTVLVFLGDHQPVTTVTGPNAGHDVPITIVARDKAVMDRISGWGWQDGLRPGTNAPVWRMDAFRDRFMSAFGSGTSAAAAGAPRN